MQMLEKISIILETFGCQRVSLFKSLGQFSPEYSCQISSVSKRTIRKKKGNNSAEKRVLIKINLKNSPCIFMKFTKNILYTN